MLIDCSNWMSSYESSAQRSFDHTVHEQHEQTSSADSAANEHSFDMLRADQSCKTSRIAQVLLQLVSAIKFTSTSEPQKPEIVDYESELKSIEHAKAANLKAEANAAFRGGDFGEAINMYTLAIAVGKESDDSLFQNRSIAYMRLGDAKSALQDALKCVEINPNNPKGHYRKARALAHLCQKRAALRSLEVAREFSPRDNRIKEFILELGGETAIDSGIELRCISDAGVSRDFDMDITGKLPVILHTFAPGDVACAVEIRRCRRSGRRRALTADGWVSLVAADGTRLMVVMDVNFLRRYGNEAYNARRFEEAAECYSEALYAAGHSAAQSHVLLANRSAAHFKLGDIDKALEDACSSVKLKPDYVRGLYRKAKALAAMPCAAQTDVLDSLVRIEMCPSLCF